MRNRQRLTFTMVALLVVVVGLSVAYAALSTTLNITANKVTQNALSWAVAFSGTSCTKAERGTSGTGRTCGNATVSGSTVTIGDTTLSKPDDGCLYTCTLSNSGTISAKFSGITPTAPSASPTGASCSVSGSTITCKNSSNVTSLTYKVGTNNTCSTALSASNTISAGGTLTIYICIDYASSTTQTATQTFTNAKYSIAFGQN